MVKGKKSYSADKSDSILILISDIKSRQHLLDKDVAKMMNIPVETFKKRKQDPGTFRFWEIWNFMQAAGVNGERKQEIL